jgi:hypothetical protein
MKVITYLTQRGLVCEARSLKALYLSHSGLKAVYYLR